MQDFNFNMDNTNAGMSSAPASAPAPMHPPHNKAHIWILVLLVWTVALSLVTIGLLVTRGESDTASAEEMALACQNGAVNAVNGNLDRLADACAAAVPGKAEEVTEEEPATAVFSESLFSFSYPLGWHIYVTSDSSHSSIDLDDEPLFSCTECGGGWPTTAIQITRHYYSSNADAGREAYTAAKFAPENGTITSNTSKTLANGTLATVTYSTSNPGCDSPGCVSSGSYEKLIFEGATDIVTVLFDASYGGEKAQEAWTTFKETVDFSKID